MGGTILSIEGSYFYSDDNLPASIQIGGKDCKLLSFEKLTDPNTRLTCQVPTPDSSVPDYSGNRGVNLITDNVYTALASLQTATPSASAVSSQTDKAYFNTNATSDVTVWMKGFLVLGKTSLYELEVKTNGEAVLLLSTDSTSAKKVSFYVKLI